MVIITDRNGQLCNRLFHFSYFIANSIEYGYPLRYPCFDQYCDFFESTVTDDFFHLAVSTKITPFRSLDRMILRYLKSHRFLFPNMHFLDVSSHSTGTIYDLKNDSYQKLVHNKIVFAKGWMFRDEENLKKHREILKKVFTPIKPYLFEVKSIMADLRKNYDCVIGVHIRRGDYISWNDGRYFFADEVYITKMEEMESQMKLEGKTTCFFVSSNEAIDKNSFAHLNVSIDQRHFITDLYTLATCDYIIGPPSTFSYWASFYGNVPLLVLENIDVNATLGNFVNY
jgi:hypothetical protein